ncbi:adenylyl-sulfate kinase [Nafulsella turpanensis]|uniref:adenylyl-sulfate kinase n=1 Tax=Nafulsella turpanensis TaxID=1265690 RepID=UPI000344C047|nr:adenylyl-sulfate kinase [Nafulsella turpanensis]
MENIHPIFDTVLQREEKEALLRQKSVVLWMVGLSGSGKSTIARALERKLHAEGYLSQLLDGDNMRSGINSNLGFSEADRAENLRRSAETAKLFLHCGVITICSFISPTAKVREQARQIIGAPDFLELSVKCSFEACARRDVKGLYKKALRGEIKNFTGLDAPFELSEHPWLEVDTEEQSLEESVETIYRQLSIRIRRN